MADLTPAERDVAPVFFVRHDAPVILYQAPSVGHFLRELFRRYEPLHASLVDDVHENCLFGVWRENLGVVEQAEVAIELLYGPFYHRLLHGHARLTDRFTRAIVAYVAAAVAQAHLDRRPAGQAVIARTD